MTRFVVLSLGAGIMAAAVVQLFRYRDIFHPIASQFFLGALIIGLRPFFLLFWSPEDVTNFVPDSRLSGLLLETMIFYLGFFAIGAATFSFARRRAPFRNITYELRTFGQSDPLHGLLAFPYVATGVVALLFFGLDIGFTTYFRNVAEERTLFSGNYLLFYSLIAPVVGACVFYGLRLRGDKRPATLFFMIAAAAISFFGAVLTGLRGYILVIGLCFLAMRAFARRKIDYRRLALFLVAAVVSLPIMNGLVYGGLSDIRSLGVSEYYSKQWEELLPYVYGRYYTFEGTARTLYFLETGSAHFDNGRLVYAFPRIVLPTAIVGEKPATSVEITRTFFFDRYGPTVETAAVTSMPAFGYWQLGWIGYVGAGILYGLVLAYWVRIYETPGMGNAIFIAITYPYLMLLFTGHVNAFAELIYIHIMLLPILKARLVRPALRREVSGEVASDVVPTTGY